MLFALAQHHNYSFYDLENMLPFERDIYFNMLINYIRTVEDKNKNGK